MQAVFSSLLLWASLTGHGPLQEELLRPLAQGAEKPGLRRWPGLMSLSLRAATSIRATHLALATAYHWDAPLQGQLALGLSVGKQKGKRCRKVFLAPSLLYLLYTTHQHCFLSLQLGPLITYRCQQAPRKREHFHVGLLVGLGLELFLYRSLSISLEIAPCYYFFKSRAPPLDYMLTLSLSYTF